MPAATLHDLSYPLLRQRLEQDGVNPAHAALLFSDLHRELIPNPAEQTNYPPPLQRWLQTAGAPGLTSVSPGSLPETASADGWTRKYLLRLHDGQEVETVLMGFEGRYTACLSTQAGCAMGCVFCATGQMGFVRNLTPGEIVVQVQHVQRFLRTRGEQLRNIVMMGMGEPLANYESVIQALDTITDRRGLNIGPAKVAISTVGHVPGILRLADHPARYHLAVSLHAATDEERSALVPANRRWPLADLLAACREYIAKTRQRVFIAWTLIDGKNDSADHARQIAGLLRGMDVHVNLIPLNPTDGYEARAPDAARVEAFQEILKQAGLPSTLRQRRGIDVAAGCGQLRAAGRRRRSIS